MATNTPLQGTAADMIKKAMLAIDKELGTDPHFLAAQEIRSVPRRPLMVLQIHDELLFDVPEGEVDRLVEMARGKMEGVVRLDVPVVVDVGIGKNWAEAH